MELLTRDEVTCIAKKCGQSKVFNWYFEEFPDKMIGYLGDHLMLIIDGEDDGIKSKSNLFVKCMPRFDMWKAEYLKELNFFKKEYVMLSVLFKEFQNTEGSKKWRPTLLFIKENIFVFENVTLLGYRMPHLQEIMSMEELKATVETLARFHAQSFIFEETKTKELGKPYRISEDYGLYLQEPEKGQHWRDTGRNALVDFLLVYSKYKSKPKLSKYVELVVHALFNTAMDLMKPSSKYRNVVVHRDLWTNNIFLKKEHNSYHALIVDFQTVLYCSPMLDLSSLIYFNTTKLFRQSYTNELIDHYYRITSEELQNAAINMNNIFDKASLLKAYEDSIVFGITQAALITPIVAMDSERREKIFCDPQTARRANVETRSKEFIETAENDINYRVRVIELFEEIVERYMYPDEYHGSQNLEFITSNSELG